MLRPWRLDGRAGARRGMGGSGHRALDGGARAVRDLAEAERWIAGADERRARWLSLDLVVERDGVVAGEVGLSSFDRDAGTAEIGWWTAAAHRGHGVASTAAGLLVRWATAELGLDPRHRPLRCPQPGIGRGGAPAPVLWSSSDVKRVP